MYDYGRCWACIAAVEFSQLFVIFIPSDYYTAIQLWNRKTIAQVKTKCIKPKIIRIHGYAVEKSSRICILYLVAFAFSQSITA